MKDNNVDLKEIAKFDSLAKEWWDPHGKMKALHLINPSRFSYISSHVSLSGKKILDVGCGAGILTEKLAEHAQAVSGIDLSTQALDAAINHAKQQNLTIDYRHISIEKLAEEMPQHFDVITCMELLEHVPKPEQIVASCAKALKPGGSLFFSTLNRNPKSFLFAIVGAEYLLNLVSKGTHHYANFIRPSELNHWVNQANMGLHLIDLSGIHYSPLTGNFSINKDVSVNYLACYRRHKHED